MTRKPGRQAALDAVTAADVVDAAFCCPLVGLYPCERERRGCYCHERHLLDARLKAAGGSEMIGASYENEFGEIADLRAEVERLTKEARMWKDCYDAEGEDLAAQRAEIERLKALVKTLAHQLEEELRGHYNPTMDYPSERRRFERDMANVYEARKALGGSEMSEKEWHPCEADRDNLLLHAEDDEILSSTRQVNIELRAEIERLRAAFSWLENEDPQLADAAREKFLSQQRNAHDREDRRDRRI